MSDSSNLVKATLVDQSQAMYDSEIDFLLVGFWDGGIDWYLGNAPSADGQIVSAKAAHTDEKPRVGNSKTIEGALADMAAAAKLSWPDSEYARGGVALSPDRDEPLSPDRDEAVVRDVLGCLSDAQFRALLNVWMVTDPIIHSDGDDAVFVALLEDEAKARGFDRVSVAYHEFKLG